MRRVMAIDPGPIDSGYALIEVEDCRPVEVGKIPTLELLAHMGGKFASPLAHPELMPERVAIEMIASYGMAVGAEVFDTCVLIGRLQQMVVSHETAVVDLVPRRTVKLHHCGVTSAKDSNITQALIDRFAKNVPNKGKGSKAEPGWFYGFRADIWQAYALAVVWADRMREGQL